MSVPVSIICWLFWFRLWPRRLFLWPGSIRLLSRLPFPRFITTSVNSGRIKEFAEICICLWARRRWMHAILRHTASVLRAEPIKEIVKKEKNIYIFQPH